MEVIQSAVAVVSAEDVKTLFHDDAHVAEARVWSHSLFVVYLLPTALVDFVLVEIGARIAS